MRRLPRESGPPDRADEDLPPGNPRLEPIGRRRGHPVTSESSSDSPMGRRTLFPPNRPSGQHNSAMSRAQSSRTQSSFSQTSRVGQDSSTSSPVGRSTRGFTNRQSSSRPKASRGPIGTFSPAISYSEAITLREPAVYVVSQVLKNTVKLLLEPNQSQTILNNSPAIMPFDDTTEFYNDNGDLINTGYERQQIFAFDEYLATDDTTRFFLDEQRITVALSRAQDGLIIIGDILSLIRSRFWKTYLSEVVKDSPIVDIRYIDLFKTDEFARAPNGLLLDSDGCVITSPVTSELIDKWLEDADMPSDK
ncbi:unnamed protein product [Anisakis simplex]|uniref:Thioredoxin-like_fold domain-containing protein n=1 Tax=Anisakis simplex TaxID=6269 RepID=A0A158PMZ3_ANISI|nr:unnamed protein product [Anisakis simplex]